MKKIHPFATLAIILSSISLACSVCYFFLHPSFDLRIIASAASAIAYFVSFAEFKKYASNFQLLGIFAGMMSMGIAVDRFFPNIPVMSIAMLASFVTYKKYFRKWFSETDFMWLDPLMIVTAASLYVYGNLHYGYGWKGWVFPAVPIIIPAIMSGLDLAFSIGSLNYMKDKKRSVEIGKPAPEFSLHDTDGKKVQLSDFRSLRHVLIIFIRSDWCPSCRIKLRTYEKHREKFQDKNIQLLTISPSSAEANKEMVMNIGIDFSVLCDTSLEVAKSYGVQLPVEVVGEKNTPGLPLPASFLIDKNGIVRYTSRPDRIGEFLDPTTIFPALEKLN